MVFIDLCSVRSLFAIVQWDVAADKSSHFCKSKLRCDQIQSANALITNHYAVFSEENSQEFYLLLEKVFGRRLAHDLDTVETLVLDFEPLSHEDIAKTEALQKNWELTKLYLILLKLRIKVLEYMTIMHDGKTYCCIQFDVD